MVSKIRKDKTMAAKSLINEKEETSVQRFHRLGKIPKAVHKPDGKWFSLNPRERDILYAMWHGKDPWIAAEELGVSRAAYMKMTSKNEIKKEIENYYGLMIITPEETAARLSEYARVNPGSLYLKEE